MSCGYLLDDYLNIIDDISLNTKSIRSTRIKATKSNLEDLLIMCVNKNNDIIDAYKKVEQLESI